MNKLYNSQIDITSNFELFLKKAVPNIRKTQLNIIPSIMFGMIISESCSSSDIAKMLKDERFQFVQFNSKIKRINRFWNNKLFEPSTFFKSILPLSLILIIKNILIIAFILFLITCFLMTIILFLCLL